MSEDIYYNMIKDKTASLFGACCELSALTSIESKEAALCFKKFGLNFGMAYQIKDDLNDLTKSSKMLGKPASLDLKKNMLTLPYIYCLDQMDVFERKKFLISLKKLSKKGRRREVQKIIKKLGGISYTKCKMDEYIQEAFNSIENIPNVKEIKEFTGNIFNEKI